MKYPSMFITGLLVLTPLSFLYALSTGSVDIGWNEIWQVIIGKEHGLNHNLIVDLRLPRATSAFLTGAMLAMAGALMQVLLRNPLADPYILGVSGGAAVAALSAMIAGLGGLWITGSAFIGALFSTFLVFGLAHRQGSWTSTRLLLTGVIVAAGWGALISFILSIAPEANLRGMLFWLMGDLSHTESSLPALVILVACFFICMPFARDLNILARGELQASALGVSVFSLRLNIYFIASILTASAVTLAGSIGFIGLIVPHIVRLITGNDNRVLLPASILTGGCFLTIADTLARTVISPQQLPVGVITAMLGVPFFLFLLQKNKQYS
jgi:iron complex transport system permease protein